MMTLLRLKYSSCKASSLAQKSEALPKKIKEGAKKRLNKRLLCEVWNDLFTAQIDGLLDVVANG